MKLSMPEEQSGRHAQIRYFMSDNADIARRAASYMLDRGYRSFAYVCKSRQSWDVERAEAFSAVLESRGYAATLIVPTASVQSQYDAIGTLPIRTAVLAADDSVARALVDYCHRQGIDIPQRIAILGVSNQKFSCRSVRPQISSVDQDFERGVPRVR